MTPVVNSMGSQMTKDIKRLGQQARKSELHPIITLQELSVKNILDRKWSTFRGNKEVKI